MSDILNGRALFIDFDSTFVKVETIDELARISLRDDPDSKKKVEMISDITNQAMSGEINFPSALNKRLSVLQLSRADVSQVTRDISKLVSNSFKENVESIRSLSESIWILSGGFREVILPIVSKFGISDQHVLANSFLYDGDRVIGCDKSSDLFQDQGFATGLQRIRYCHFIDAAWCAFRQRSTRPKRWWRDSVPSLLEKSR